MSKYDAVYFVGDNQVIKRVQVGSSKTRNRGAFLDLLAALLKTIVLNIFSHSKIIVLYIHIFLRKINYDGGYAINCALFYIFSFHKSHFLI